MNIVSRGGSLVFAWMSMTGEENPFYEYYDEILDICEEYDVTISLGVAFVAGKKRVPKPAAGITALRIRFITIYSL